VPATARAALAYLHGFASGPGSKKARFFAERFAALGVRLAVPDLNAGEDGLFGLTVTRMLAGAGAAAAQARAAEGLRNDAPVVLVGSSLGGYVAALTAARDRSVAAVVLLAPAFDFGRRFLAGLEARGVAGQAAERGYFEAFDYARGAETNIGYALITDALAYDPFPDVHCPALILHGARDALVPVELSRTFAAGRATARLVVLDDEHQLLATTDRLWEEMRVFLAPFLPGVGPGC
jgi:pimeloyl-ACP methyl ester carboxylesterase